MERVLKGLGIAGLVTMVLLSPPLWAIEKDGLLVDVQETVLDRNDGPGGDYREIRRNMGLKLKVKNNSFRDLEAGNVQYTILIQSWSAGESSAYRRYTGQTKIETLLRSKFVDLVLGEYPIGGHLHGTSRQHVDDLAGWKLDFVFGEKKISLSKPSGFDRMNAKAQTVKRN